MIIYDYDYIMIIYAIRLFLIYMYLSCYYRMSIKCLHSVYFCMNRRVNYFFKRKNLNINSRDNLHAY